MRYRIAAFTHWMNLAALAGGLGFAAITDSFLLGLATVLLEAATLWILPDLPQFRRVVDANRTMEGLGLERAHYVRELFGLELGRPGPIKWFKHDPSNDNYLAFRGTAPRRSDSWTTFRDLLRVSNELHALATARPNGSLTVGQLAQVEVAVNGWLRLQYGAVALDRAVARVPEAALWVEVDALKEQIRKASPIHAAVLKERLRQALHKLRALPKLIARLELFRAKGDNIAYSIQQMGDAAAASQGSDVALLAEGLVDQYELLESDLAELQAQNDMREFLGEIDWAKELAAPSAAAVTPAKVLAAPKAQEEDLDTLEAELRAENWRHVPVRS